MTGTWVPSLDASFDRPDDWAAVYHAGYRLFAGYAGLGSKGKWTTKSELATILAHGIGFAALSESTTDRMITAGTAGAINDAKVSREAFDVLGYGHDMPIIYACDTDVSMTQIKGPIASYLEHSAQGDPHALPGFYGENDAIDWLYEQGLISVGFDAGAAYLWGNPAVRGAYSKHGVMRQESNGHKLAGGTVDIGHVLTSAPFLWPHVDTPAPKPPAPAVYVETARYTTHNPPWNSYLSGIASRENTSVSRLLALNPQLHGNPNVIPFPGKIRVK